MRTYRKSSRLLRFVYRKTPILDPSRLFCRSVLTCAPRLALLQLLLISPLSSFSLHVKILCCCNKTSVSQWPLGRPMKSKTHNWLMKWGGGAGRNSKLTLSSVFWLMHTFTPMCWTVLFCVFFLSFFFGLDDFLFKIVARLHSEWNHFPFFCLCHWFSGSALSSLAAIQFRQIPVGIQLKFLLNNQLNKQRRCLFTERPYGLLGC